MISPNPIVVSAAKALLLLRAQTKRSNSISFTPTKALPISAKEALQMRNATLRLLPDNKTLMTKDEEHGDDSYLVMAHDAIRATPLSIGLGPDGYMRTSSEMRRSNDHLNPINNGSTEYIEHVYLNSPIDKNLIKRFKTGLLLSLLLSDGPKSSLNALATVCLAGKKEASQCGTKLHPLCYDLKGSPYLKAAMEVEHYLGTVKHELYFTIQDAIDAMEDVIYHTETITTRRASILMFLISPEIFKALGVKMVISGEASDEKDLHNEAPLKPDLGWTEKRVLHRTFYGDYLQKKHLLYMQEAEFSNSEERVSGMMMLNARIFERFFPKNSAKLMVPGGPGVVSGTTKAIECVAELADTLDPADIAALLAQANIPASMSIGYGPMILLLFFFIFIIARRLGIRFSF